MPAIRFRKNNVCAVVLSDIPGHATAYVKKKPSSQSADAPVEWLGFICKSGARIISSRQRGKLIAKAITNGNAISGDWRELRDDQYVVCVLAEVDSVLGYGAYAVVDRDGWPIVRDEHSPMLRVVAQTEKTQLLKFK